MGGEGSMLQAIKSLQFNRNQLKKRKTRSKNDVYGKSGVTELNIKQSTEADMIWVRKKIALQKKKNRQHGIVAFVLTIILCILIFMFLYYSTS